MLSRVSVNLRSGTCASSKTAVAGALWANAFYKFSEVFLWKVSHSRPSMVQNHSVKGPSFHSAHLHLSYFYSCRPKNHQIPPLWYAVPPSPGCYTTAFEQNMSGLHRKYFKILPRVRNSPKLTSVLISLHPKSPEQSKEETKYEHEQYLFYFTASL